MEKSLESSTLRLVILRERDEDERLTGGELRHRDAVLQARGDGGGERAHRIQSQVGGDEAAHHLGAGLAGVEARIGF